MNLLPKISVCMITYNHEGYIEQAVRSVLMQETDCEYEIVIGEDCSTDRTREILLRLADEAPNRIRLLLRESNLGVNRNFLETYASCRGKYIALLEGDDYWTDPTKLARQAAAMDAHQEWSICFHRTMCVDENGIPTGIIYPSINCQPSISLEDLLFANCISTQSVVYRAGALGILPDLLQDTVNLDWLLNILHAQQGEIGFLPELMSCYRIHPGGIWTSKREAERLAEIIATLTRLEPILGPDYRTTLQRARVHHIDHAMASLEDLRNSLTYRTGHFLTWPLHALWRFYARFH
jgi:glycosyltransferase involved in cell wall biosynthesis